MKSRVGIDCLLWLFAVLLTLTVALPARAESQWIEVQSPHFSVVTDAGEKRGREVAVRFEQMRAVFAALMNKANVNIPVPLQIVAFRNGKELRQVAPLWHGKPTQVAGLFQGGQDRSFIMLDMSVEDPWSVVFHENAHQLMNGVLGTDVDPWFEEGFAEYFSSIEVDGKQARVGKVPQLEYDILREQGTIRIADLMKVQHNSATYNESGDHRTVFYAESGMLMHFIYDNGLIPRVATFFDLKINQGVPVEQAIQQSFGMSPSQFDKVFRSYVSAGRYRYYPLATPRDIVEKGYSVKPLGPNDTNALIADIHLHSPDYREKAVSEFQDVLKSDPNNAAACRGLGYAYLEQRDFKQAREYFKRASQVNSSDARVHYYWALLANQDSTEAFDAAEVIRELDSAIALDPGFADAYMLRGYAAARAGNISAGITNMEKAVSLNPRNETYRFNLAQMYLTDRQVKQGMAILQGLSKSSDPMVAQRAADLLIRAREFQSASGTNSDERILVTDDGTQVLVRRQQDGSDTAEQAPQNVKDSELTNAKLEKSAEQKADAINFLKGTVESVDCSSPPAASLVLRAAGKVWNMRVPDTQHTIVMGADKFSCAWKGQNVAINYRETSDSAGTVVSIEVQ